MFEIRRYLNHWTLVQVLYLVFVPLIFFALFWNVGYTPKPKQRPNSTISVPKLVDRQFQIRFHNFHLDYMMYESNPHVCDGKQTAVLIMSRAGIEGYLFRKAIRASWLHPDRVPPEFVYRFVVGRSVDPEIAEIDERLLDWESTRYGDLLRYSLPDLYSNLYLKAAVMFEWKVSYCLNATYMLKLDDDTVMSLERLSYWMHQEFSAKMRAYPRSVLCYVLQDRSPIREPSDRWQVPVEEFPLAKYPDYCRGAFYLMTHDAVAEIHRRTGEVAKIRIEDVLFTGILGDRANIIRFNTNAVPSTFLTKECGDDKVPTMMGLSSVMHEEVGVKFDNIMSLSCSDEKSTT